MNIATKTLLTAWTAASAAAALCFSGAVLAHDAMAHAAMNGAAQMGVDHAKHAAMTSGAAAGRYQRSLQSYAIPNVVLTDADARPVPLRELLAADEPVMLNFIFTTCGTICPVMTKVFSDVPAQLGGDAKRLRMVSISIDPERDTPAELKAYAKQYEAGPRWKFLTGRVKDVESVERAFGSYRGDKMNHEPLTLLRGAPDAPWVRIDGFATPQDLAREYHKVVMK